MIVTISLCSLIYRARCSKGSQDDCLSHTLILFNFSYVHTRLWNFSFFSVDMSLVLILLTRFWILFLGGIQPQKTVFKNFLTLCLKLMCITGWSGINSYICNTKRILVSLIPHQNIFQTTRFCLSGRMNTQYNRNWSIGNPQLIHFWTLVFGGCDEDYGLVFYAYTVQSEIVWFRYCKLASSLHFIMLLQYHYLHSCALYNCQITSLCNSVTVNT